MIDFTNCPKIIGRAYNGANGKKIAVEYNGKPYILKFPLSGGNKRTELSYTNSCISEHIASSIFNLIGILAQETILSLYTVGGKQKVVCACLDFTADGSRFLIFVLSRIRSLIRIPTEAVPSLTMFWTPLKGSNILPRISCWTIFGMCL